MSRNATQATGSRGPQLCWQQGRHGARCAPLWLSASLRDFVSASFRDLFSFEVPFHQPSNWRKLFSPCKGSLKRLKPNYSTCCLSQRDVAEAYDILLQGQRGIAPWEPRTGQMERARIWDWSQAIEEKIAKLPCNYRYQRGMPLLLVWPHTDRDK